MEGKDGDVLKGHPINSSYVEMGNIKEWRHIAENFEVLGFSTPELGLLQSAKELMENALDACKMLRNDDCKVGIIIRESGVENMVEVEVSDNGCGMIDPEFMLNCFVTTKRTAPERQEGTSNPNDKRPGIGKFGVGLSACFLYSQTHTDIPLKLVNENIINLNNLKKPMTIRILSKTQCQNMASITEFKFCLANGKVEIRRQYVTEESNGKKMYL